MQADFDGTSGIFPSDVQAAILKLKNSGELGRGKKFTRREREKEKLGKGEGEGKEKFFLPSILSFSLQLSQSAANSKWRQNTRKTTKTACTAGYVFCVFFPPSSMLSPL